MGEVELVDVASVVSDMLELLRVSVSKHATLTADLEWGLGGVRANPAQLRQLVMNLVSNASDAIGERDGVIHLITRRKVLPDGEYVQLCVSDTGRGIPPEALSQVFDPFFTTKAGGHGHGLGLAVVQGIVQRLGGAVSIRSDPGQGTTFEILLPSASEAAPTSEKEGETVLKAEAKDPKGEILVVEDEHALREGVSKFLRIKGFSVTEAADGTAAVDLLQSRGTQIGVVLLDVTLPGKSSHEVFEEAGRLKPGVPVIVTSAYSQDKIAGSFPGTRIEYFIRKPFRLTQLVELVRTILSA